jgi:PEP-CTERM motif
LSDAARPVRVRRSRSIRRQRIRRTLFLCAALVILLVAVRQVLSFRSVWSSNQDNDLEWAQGNLSQRLALLATKAVSSPLTLPRRVVYPYSVIPGGVRTPEDLLEVSEHDRIVGGHYAGFNFRNAKIVELDQPHPVYLSYRLGDKIFWTSKRVSLPKGEKLITDGKMTARVRCANQVSEQPQFPVSAAEPPAGNFETPFDGTAGAIPFPGDLNGLGSGRELGPIAPPILRTSTAPFPGGGLPPVFSPPIPSKSCAPPGIKEDDLMRSGNTKPCPSPKPHSHQPPPPVPEPSTLLLVCSGIAGIYWRRRKAATKN